MANSADDADVLILGAGAAGLAAARRLVSTRKVLVLEGRDRVGGRILTHRSSNFPLPIDLGPEFIHGRPKETFELLEESGLIAVDASFQHYDANEEPPQEDDQSWDEANELLASIKLADGEDLSFDDYLKRHPNLKPAVAKRARQFVEGFNAAEAGRISVRSILESNAEEDAQDGERQYRLIGGYDQLVQALARSIEQAGNGSRILCDTTVRQIKWQAGRVEVTADTAGGRRVFTARQAIIALPLGVLQQPADAEGGIRFDPVLPTRSLIDSKLIMGAVRKFTLQCRTPFWEEWGDMDASFFHRRDAAIPVWWNRLPIRTNLLVGWAGGGEAKSLPGHAMGLRKLAVESLSLLFDRSPEAIDAEILAIHVHDWSADPFSRGAYSYVAVGGASAPDEIAKPIANTLFFAGEHTHRGLIGTVAGAIRTGYRAADLILASDAV